jgi:glutathione S-transferase
MITLYQFHWSHYVEKVRWALDYKGVRWTAVEVEPFSKREMLHLRCELMLDSGRKLYAVPTIHDKDTGTVISDSSRILDYLERTYPQEPLYPQGADATAEMKRWMLWLDSTLGLAARRLAYTQITLEHPGILATLFIPQKVDAHNAEAIKGSLSGAVIGGVLSQRFRFTHNQSDRVFENLEQCLLIIAQRLGSRRYLVGERFTAADLTLAALLRPVMLLPFFRKHSELQELFAWRRSLLEVHRREARNFYETALHEIRQRRGWALGDVRWLSRRPDERKPVPTQIPEMVVARNDQQSVGRWPLLSGPAWYLQLKATCGLGRTAYP